HGRRRAWRRWHPAARAQASARSAARYPPLSLRKASSPSSAPTQRRRRRPAPGPSQSGSSAPGSFLRSRRRIAFADDGEIEIAVLVDNHLFDPGQDLLHGFGIQAVACDLRSFSVFGLELREAGCVAAGGVDAFLLVGFRLLDQLPRLAARFGDHVVGVTFSLIDDAYRIGAGAGNVAKGIGGFWRRRDAFDVDGGEQDARAIVIDALL